MADGKTALIIGASRGLGLGLVERFAERGWSVTATVRDPVRATELNAVAERADGRVSVQAADIADDSSVTALKGALNGGGFDLLFLNPGVWAPGVADGDLGEIARAFHVNATGPARAAHALLDRVTPETGVVAFMTSRMGSIADDSSGGSEVYRASKAAQNAFARAFHMGAAKTLGVTTVSMHPGWVRTDMGGPNAPLDVATSTRGMADVCVASAGRGDHRFLQYDGGEVPW